MSVPYTLTDASPTQVGFIVLQTDETLEQDMRRLLPADLEHLVTRVPSADTVTSDTLQAMAASLTDAARLLPSGAQFASVAYCCTSGTAQIGALRVADLVRAGVKTPTVTDPVTALVAACRHLGVTRLALLSPYIASVSDRLRAVLADEGITVTAFASFDEPLEERVVRISSRSVIDAATALGGESDSDAVFLSCTNLRTLDAIPEIEERTGKTVLSSNLVLAWHVAHLAGATLARDLPYMLAATPAATRPGSSR